MNHFRTMAFVILVLGPVGDAAALQGSAGVECVAGDHVLTVGGWLYEESDREITGLYFRRESIGVCEPEVILPDSPLPFEPIGDPGDYARYSATVTVTPPRPDVTYRYVPFAVRADGSEERILANCDSDFRSYALAGCADAPIQRGRVELSFFCPVGDFCIEIVPCEANCWSEFFGDYLSIEDFVDLTGESAGDLLGEVVDLYGTRTYCTMPGGNYHDITRIERAPAGACGPVPVEETTWGSFKARYR